MGMGATVVAGDVAAGAAVGTTLWATVNRPEENFHKSTRVAEESETKMSKAKKHLIPTKCLHCSAWGNICQPKNQVHARILRFTKAMKLKMVFQ
ncbi:hypothetical protein CEB3_c28340 [Peptococcaceae bacterium CEB3]|nr:hypothetical protein CEB3_c28340 [Peptococcaceae bacterium CEB3]